MSDSEEKYSNSGHQHSQTLLVESGPKSAQASQMFPANSSINSSQKYPAKSNPKATHHGTLFPQEHSHKLDQTFYTESELQTDRMTPSEPNIPLVTALEEVAGVNPDLILPNCSSPPDLKTMELPESQPAEFSPSESSLLDALDSEEVPKFPVLPSSFNEKGVSKKMFKSFARQLLDLIPKDKFDELVRQYNTEKAAKGFTSWSHFITMLLVQLLGADSLRDIAGLIHCSPERLVELRMDSNVNKSTLSYANKNRDWHLFADVFHMLVDQIQKKYKNHSKKRFEFKNPLYSIDATIISVCLKVFDWAKYRTGKGAVKINTLLSHDTGFIPTFVTITEGKVADINAAEELIQQTPKGAIIAMDRGYISYDLFYKIELQGKIAVTRTKVTMNFTEIESLPILIDPVVKLIDNPSKKTNFKVVSDSIVVPSSKEQAKICPIKLRIVKIIDEDNNEQMEFLTNQLDYVNFSAETIANIYRDRWWIESFFKTIKQNMIVKSFLGTSFNAVCCQIYAALSSIVLIKYVLSLCIAVKWNFSNFIYLLRNAFFLYGNFFHWIQIDHCERPPPIPPKKVNAETRSLF
jgi:hypothetical protein